MTIDAIQEAIEYHVNEADNRKDDNGREQHALAVAALRCVRHLGSKAAEALLEVWAPEYLEPTTYHVPGTFRAHLRHDGYVSFEFSPSASYAGWFGPAATEEETGLAVNLDHPLFTAIQLAMPEDSTIQVRWTE